MPALPPPPNDQIQVRGAQLIRVWPPHGGPRRPGGFEEAVALAWARLGDGRWGALLAWAGHWRSADQRITSRPRWGWVPLEQERVTPMPPRRQHDRRAAWHGQHPTSALAQAVDQAAATLPAHLQKAAVTRSRNPGMTKIHDEAVM
jgi:hypothetical protein